jgi:hypothetical protein
VGRISKRKVEVGPQESCLTLLCDMLGQAQREKALAVCPPWRSVKDNIRKAKCQYMGGKQRCTW